MCEPSLVARGVLGGLVIAEIPVLGYLLLDTGRYLIGYPLGIKFVPSDLPYSTLRVFVHTPGTDNN